MSRYVPRRCLLLNLFPMNESVFPSPGSSLVWLQAVDTVLLATLSILCQTDHNYAERTKLQLKSAHIPTLRFFFCQCLISHGSAVMDVFVSGVKHSWNLAHCPFCPQHFLSKDDTLNIFRSGPGIVWNAPAGSWWVTEINATFTRNLPDEARCHALIGSSVCLTHQFDFPYSVFVFDFSFPEHGDITM